MAKRSRFDVTLRHTSTGEVHKRTIISADKEAAGKAAIWRARNAKEATMVKRHYESYEVASCKPAQVAAPKRT